MLIILPPTKRAVKLQVNTVKQENVPAHLSWMAGIIEVYGIEVFMGELGRVADRVVPKKSTRRLKYSKARCGLIFLSLSAHF